MSRRTHAAAWASGREAEAPPHRASDRRSSFRRAPCTGSPPPPGLIKLYACAPLGTVNALGASPIRQQARVTDVSMMMFCSSHPSSSSSQQHRAPPAAIDEQQLPCRWVGLARPSPWATRTIPLHDAHPVAASTQHAWRPHGRGPPLRRDTYTPCTHSIVPVSSVYAVLECIFPVTPPAPRTWIAPGNPSGPVHQCPSTSRKRAGARVSLLISTPAGLISHIAPRLVDCARPSAPPPHHLATMSALRGQSERTASLY